MGYQPEERKGVTQHMSPYGHNRDIGMFMEHLKIASELLGSF